MKQELAPQEYVREIIKNEGRYFNEVSMLKRLFFFNPPDVFSSYLDLGENKHDRPKVVETCNKLNTAGLLDKKFLPVKGTSGSFASYRINENVYGIIANYVNDKVLK